MAPYQILVYCSQLTSQNWSLLQLSVRLSATDAPSHGECSAFQNSETLESNIQEHYEITFQPLSVGMFSEDRKLFGSGMHKCLKKKSMSPSHLKILHVRNVTWSMFYTVLPLMVRARWSRGSVLAFRTPKFAGSNPAEPKPFGFFRAKKKSSARLPRRGSKKPVPCRRFAAFKRTL
jgi:hypothetical protein